MTRMTEPEWRAFLSHGTRTGKLATTRADGRPHVTPVWFVLDGEDIVLNTAASSVKGRSLARDPRAMLCVDDQQPPYSFVLVQGRAELSEDPAELRHWAGRIGARYMGEDRAEEFAARNGAPGELLVRLRIEKVDAQAAVSA
ncbi:PPOX class F420-dependent oxidoreductase [Kitasatospora sp. DSM 101779]|uniref:PPOX class F420-dependent oxidoreductase n=1 Tax=Kitasatospora sp. DSM 101779 TaxID=2853165 RepID=UPI0021DAA040|nr:PPOX class F420-dependent oxidoreductase [Kitasatospora sp. DSM 101779]MCU7823837.1 PPOX class F420-dependent oxidoreductase [Kitasatospora sp. DSM 101779]